MGGFGLDVGFNAIIDGYSKFGMVSRAVGLMECGRQEGVLPDIDTLIDGLCRMGELGKAKDLMDEVLGIKKDVSTSELNWNS